MVWVGGVDLRDDGDTEDEVDSGEEWEEKCEEKSIGFDEFELVRPND